MLFLDIILAVYTNYDLGTHINCDITKVNNGFTFNSWFGSFASNSNNVPKTTFTASDYGTLDANFNPVATFYVSNELLYGVILGPTVGAILGGILGWYIPYLMNKRVTNKDINKSNRRDGEENAS